MCASANSLMDSSGPEARGVEMVGQSSALRIVLEQIRLVAGTDSTVLILGETGTGKELIARRIHSMSDRANRPFIKVNCAAMPFDLLESELFGHERGAFTGAIARRPGRFEVAHGGTLFLDEIGDMPLASQPKLLRVLQEGEFERVGSSRTQHVDVRLIVATHRDLKTMARSDEFRSDLYYRLNVFPVTLPPLRERRDDIVPLIWHFIGLFSRKMRKEITSVSEEMLISMLAHDWPGNIRELQNVVERAVILSQNGVFPDLRGQISNDALADTAGRSACRHYERDTIVRTLRETNWVVGGARGAAVKLGIKRTTLIARMKKFGIECEKWPKFAGSQFWTECATGRLAEETSINLPPASNRPREQKAATLN